jgi:hypothetical protein
LGDHSGDVIGDLDSVDVGHPLDEMMKTIRSSGECDPTMGSRDVQTVESLVELILVEGDLSEIDTRLECNLDQRLDLGFSMRCHPQPRLLHEGQLLRCLELDRDVFRLRGRCNVWMRVEVGKMTFETTMVRTRSNLGLLPASVDGLIINWDDLLAWDDLAGRRYGSLGGIHCDLESLGRDGLGGLVDPSPVERTPLVDMDLVPRMLGVLVDTRRPGPSVKRPSVMRKMGMMLHVRSLDQNRLVKRIPRHEVIFELTSRLPKCDCPTYVTLNLDRLVVEPSGSEYHDPMSRHGRMLVGWLVLASPPPPVHAQPSVSFPSVQEP